MVFRIIALTDGGELQALVSTDAVEFVQNFQCEIPHDSALEYIDTIRAIILQQKRTKIERQRMYRDDE